MSTNSEIIVKTSAFLVLAVLLGGLANDALSASAETARNGILADLAVEAGIADPNFDGFSAERGGAFFTARPAGGKPDTPACTACHTKSPQARGETRAGKPIEPMAVSMTPDRYSDPAKLAKWFRRNCKSVLGRECTAREKGDFIAFMSTQ